MRPKQAFPAILSPLAQMQKKLCARGRQNSPQWPADAHCQYPKTVHVRGGIFPTFIGIGEAVAGAHEALNHSCGGRASTGRACNASRSTQRLPLPSYFNRCEASYGPPPFLPGKLGQPAEAAVQRGRRRQCSTTTRHPNSASSAACRNWTQVKPAQAAAPRTGIASAASATASATRRTRGTPGGCRR
jgi:hypothetical protein